MTTTTAPQTSFVVITISARVTEQEVVDLEKAFREQGKKALANFNLNDDSRDIVFTWNFFERKK